MNSVSLPLINFRKFITGEKWVLWQKKKIVIDPGQPTTSTAKLNIHAKKFLVKVKAPNQFTHLINLLFYLFLYLLKYYIISCIIIVRTKLFGYY